MDLNYLHAFIWFCGAVIFVVAASNNISSGRFWPDSALCFLASILYAVTGALYLFLGG